MLYELWFKVAYMTQLACICFLFILPQRKRPHWAASFTACAAGLLGFFYLLGQWLSAQTGGAGANVLIEVVRLIAYLPAAWLLVFVTVNRSWLEALYLTLHACTVQHIAHDIYTLVYVWSPDQTTVHFLFYFLIYVAIYVAGYRWLAVPIARNDSAIGKGDVLPLATVVTVVWGTSVIESAALPETPDLALAHTLYRLLDIVCCFYVLWVQWFGRKQQELRREIDGIRGTWARQSQQFQITNETIDAINRKCHDLKYQILRLREAQDDGERLDYLDQLEHDIQIYDSAIKTGNKAVDTLLMDKGLYCRDHGIEWSCMADAKSVGFMDLEDLYSILGNAIDNAIEAVEGIQDPDKRIVSLRAFERQGFCVIQVKNYFEGEMCFVDGLPQTTKVNREEHGFGMKSIRWTAEKYGGTITARADGNVFMLQVLIPIPDQSDA